MNTVIRSAEFSAWLNKLRDVVGRARIIHRAKAAGLGHFGDCRSVGEGVYEMRIHCGPGYRIYYLRAHRSVYLLLVGGDKSTQEQDIKRALELARELRMESWQRR